MRNPLRRARVAALIVVLLCWSFPTVRAAENPFLAFMGKYRAKLVDCRLNGDPVAGCGDLIGVELKRRRDGSLHLIEEGREGPQDYQIDETSTEDGSETAVIIGTSDRAEWNYTRVFRDGSESLQVKLFLKEADGMIYHTVHRERDTAGIDFSWKQTYVINPASP